MNRSIVSLLLLVCGCLSLLAQDDLREELEAMKQRMQQLEKTNKELRQKVEKLEKKTETSEDPMHAEIEAEVDELLGEEDFEGGSLELRTPIISYDLGGGATAQLLDISIDTLVTVGTSTAKEEEIQQLQAGGHDHKKRGFTLQQVEFSATGAIDPYVRAYVHFVFLIDEEGETVVELEEAYFVTQTLPYGLQAKVGHFFTAVGLHNTHPHSWHFVDQPVIYSRFFGGDGLRVPGAQLSWLVPFSWYSEFIVSVQNANGETAFSFLSSEEEEEFAGHTFIERDVQSFRDLLYTLRWVNAVQLGEFTTQAGYTFLYGPNATGNDAYTYIHGADFVVKWKPQNHKRGFPFVIWQSEILFRRYFAEAGDGVAVDEHLEDWGAYTQLVYGFVENWVAAARYEFARGDRGDADFDFLRDERQRISANMTYYPSHFFKIRLQYNLDKSQEVSNGDWEHSVWMQFEFLLGTHGAHKFY